MATLSISIAAEPVIHLGPVVLSNSILASWIVTAFIVGVSLWAHKNVKLTKRPKGLQNFLEMLIEGLHGMTTSITESSVRTEAFFPFFLSFFLFILLNNWFGLLPGVGTIGYVEREASTEEVTKAVTPAFVKQVQASEDNTEQVPVTGTTPNQTESAPKTTPRSEFVPYLRAATADLNTTVALALISVIATQVVGIKFQGLAYFKKFLNLKGPIDAFVGILEAISEISKIISFAFRLFGNIFAGEVLLAVMSSLVPIIVPSPFIGMEIFVGAIQAFVFAMLTLVFMQMASHGHEGEAHA